jgi:predicted MFS family arabinose efflux permease
MPVPMGGVGVTKFAPEAPTLMGAMNLAAAPNVGNAFGAWGRRRSDRSWFRLAVGG